MSEMELTGIHLDDTPIPFEEGGMLAWADWHRWLVRHSRQVNQLRLLIDQVDPADHIYVTITKEGARATSEGGS